MHSTNCSISVLIIESTPGDSVELINLEKLIINKGQKDMDAMSCFYFGVVTKSQNIPAIFRNIPAEYSEFSRDIN